jgi:transcription elongation factor
VSLIGRCRPSADKVGVVIRIEKERLHILNMDGKVQTVSVQSVTKRRVHRNATALDSQNNSLNVADIVNVLDGPFAVRPTAIVGRQSLDRPCSRTDKAKSNISIGTSSSSFAGR